MTSKTKVIMSLLSCSVILAACGNGEEGAADDGDASEQLDITWRGTGDPDYVEDYILNFQESYENEQDEITLGLDPIVASEEDYFSNVALSMQSSDTAPEIVNQDTFMISSDANAGYLANLDEYVEDWEEWDNFNDSVIDGVTGEDGSIYAIPATTDTRGIWYNKSVFEEAGLPEEWQPESWDDILEAAEAVRDNTEAIPFSMNVATVGGEATTMQTFQMLLYGTGETMYDEDTEEWNVTGEGIVDSLTFIDEIMNQRDLGPSLGVAINEGYGSVMFQDYLPDGEVGMVLDGIWNHANYQEDGVAPLEDPEAELGFAMMPTQDGQDPGFTSMAGGWAWAIPENSDSHDASWETISEMSTEEWQLERVLREGNITVREDSAEAEEYIEQPFIETATDALDYAHFRPKHDLYPNVSVFVQSAVEAVATGSMTPEEAAEVYQDEVNNLVGEESTY